MQLKPVFKLTLLLALVLLLAVGCAKKPKAEDANKVGQTEMQQETVAEVSEQPVTEQASGMGQEQTPMVSAVSSLQRIHFDYDQYVLTADARAMLEDNASYLKAKGVSVRIEGYCDDRGSDEYNLALGERRALAVKSYLTSLGVSAERMSIISYGEEMPLALGHSEEAWAQNRRVEFKELY